MKYYSSLIPSLYAVLLASAFNLFFVTISYCAAHNPSALKQGAQAPGLPAADAKLSNDDIKMLQDVEQEINKFVGSLPPEEQKKFWQEVDDLTKVMSTMNEDELVKFMEGVLQEQETQAPLPASTPPPYQPAAYSQPFTPAPVVEKAPEVAQPQTQTAKHDQLIKLIESITLMLGNFLTKAQAIPDLAGKVESWIKEGKLHGAPKGTSWNTLRSSIEELISALNKIKDRDPATGIYRYLDDLLKEEGLLSNLKRIKDVLMRYEPKIDISPFGVERMNKQTRESIRTVLNTMIEATTILDVKVALYKVIEKYDPIAKTLREKEEAAQRQAFDASRRMPYTTPAVVAGRAETAPSSTRDYSKFDFGTPAYNPAPIPKPAQEPAKESPLDKKDEKKDGAAGGKGADAKKPDETKGKDKLEDEDKEAAKYFAEFSECIFKATMLIDEREKEIKGQKDKPLSGDDDVTTDLNDIYQQVRTAVLSLKKLNRRLTLIEKTRPASKAKFRKAVADAMQEAAKDLAKVPSSAPKGAYSDTVTKISDKIKELKEVTTKFQKGEK